MKAEDFIRKWSRSKLKESAAYQTHFNDLCAVLGVKAPAEEDPTGEKYAFERQTKKAQGRIGFADVWKRGHFAWEYKGPEADLDAALDQLRQYLPALENPPLLAVSDTKRIIIHTNWNNTAQETHTFELEDLRDPAKLEQLRFAFEEPDRLKPDRTPQRVTNEAAESFGRIVQSLRDAGYEARRAARFATKLLFCLFAEDIGLQKHKPFRDLLKTARESPMDFVQRTEDFFQKMERGGWWGSVHILWYNGGLFDDHEALPLTKQALEELFSVASKEWRDIDPAIFGTLFERGMDPDKASQVGAHYTDAESIRLVLEPVLLEPLRADWAARLKAIKEHLTRAETTRSQATRRREHSAAQRLYDEYGHRLSMVRVLDAACGSGNFLYVALRGLMDLEYEAFNHAAALGLQTGLPQVDSRIVHGIEIGPYAAELARVTIWIGQLQWLITHGYGPPSEPILPTLESVEQRDALLNPDGSEADWPAVDVIVGNPPFLGDKKMIAWLGEERVRALRACFKGRVPAGADLVTYWFEKARAEIAAGKASRAGLVATNSIRGGANRKVLHRVAQDCSIFHAWADRPWVVEGAAVRVSIVGFAALGDPATTTRILDGNRVDEIYTNLTGRKGKVGVDTTQAVRRNENSGVSFIGTQKTGKFDIPGDLARQWLQLPANPNGRPNSDVLKPWMNGRDVTQRHSDNWIIDFGTSMSEADAALYEAPFGHVLAHVKPVREKIRRQGRRKYWWRFGETMPGVRAAINGLDRYIATPRVAKYLFFVWLYPRTIPDCQLVVIARDDDVAFGILHARFHCLWASRMGTSLEDRPRYTPTTTFETFPFPEGLTPDRPAQEYMDDPRAISIADAARELDSRRNAWLNPPEWIRVEPEVVPGYPDRTLPKNDAVEKQLRKHTLTSLYNQMPQWLADAHRKLDEAVAAAYGWPADISDEAVLRELLALNQERAALRP